MPGKRGLMVVAGLALLAVAEFLLPHYVSRAVMRLGSDLGLVRYADPRANIPAEAVRANEFAFLFVPLPGLAVKARAAGVSGLPGQPDFWMAEQGETRLGPYDVSGLLAAEGWVNGTAFQGGVTQIISLDGRNFGLGGFIAADCHFAALIDLDRMAVADRFPCLPDGAEDLNFTGLGGGYVVRDGALYMALGTASDAVPSAKNDLAQDAGSPYGKILRYDIGADGSLTNRRIYTSGHRNPQGMLLLGEMMLAVEHGPKGGDEINLIVEGQNYGWPLYSAGSGYDDRDIPSYAPADAGFANPIFSFVPSIGISDLTECPHVMAEKKGGLADCLIVASMRGRSLFIVLGDFAAGRVYSVEQVPVGARVREAFVADDVLYLVPDAASVMRVDITPF